MADVQSFLYSTRITVAENERTLVLIDGRFHDILGAGRHSIASLFKSLDVERHGLTTPEFKSTYDQALFRERPDLVEKHLYEVRTASGEMAVIYRNGKLFGVQGQDGRSVFWRDAGPWEVDRVDVSDDLEVPAALARRLAAASSLSKVKRFNVDEGQTGLLYIDQAFVKEIGPGVYTFWETGRPVAVRLIDTRWQSLDVTGQEVLTRDRVSIRVNVSAAYRVTDPVKAVSEVKDFSETLYRALQVSFRRSLGTRTLDQILEKKEEADAQASAAVRAELAPAGVEVGDITIKDIVLPGDMREILNKVVLAEKEAEANVIRRREETAATRSLLNTAKVMEENPVMLRLKELEALEKISDKVQNLVVHSGTQGLLEDVVSLRAPAVKRAAKKG